MCMLDQLLRSFHLLAGMEFLPRGSFQSCYCIKCGWCCRQSPVVLFESCRLPQLEAAESNNAAPSCRRSLRDWGRLGGSKRTRNRNARSTENEIWNNQDDQNLNQCNHLLIKMLSVQNSNARSRAVRINKNGQRVDGQMDCRGAGTSSY